MPGRATRKASTVLAAPASPSSPQTKANGPVNARKRRVLDEAPADVEEDLASSPRRSKRSKTDGAVNTKNTRINSRSNERVQLKTEEIEENGIELSVTPSKYKSRGAGRASLKASVEDQEVKEEVEIDVVEETKETLTKRGTPKKKRKTKEEKAMEAIPIATRTQGLRMFVGAHVSAAKGVHNSLINSTYIGGNALALFLQSQRKWNNPPLLPEVRDQFRKLCIEHKYDASKYVLPHGSYLVNLAQEDKAKAKQAYDAFMDDLKRCEELGITLYNFHPGTANQTSHSSAISRLANALTKAISETSTVVPVLETMCGSGTTIGGSLSDLSSVIALIPPEYRSRIGICIDTCHSFAAGYDLVSPAGFQAFMTEFEEKIGTKYIRALHLNDSKAPRGSKRDLHANIGTGFLGLRAFHNVMNEKRFEGIPMILETPIDRPDPTWQGPSATSNGAAEGEETEENDEESDFSSDSEMETKKKPKKAKSKKSVKAASQKPPTIEDKSVWAREIKLLESLIGMDPECAEFRELEARLSEEGRAERERIQAQHERKLEAEEKKRRKELEKGQKTLLDMMDGEKRKANSAKGTAKKSPKAKKKKMTARDDSDESDGCLSH